MDNLFKFFIFFITNLLVLTTFVFSSSAKISPEKFLDEASLYTVKFRTTIEKPFREDKKVGLRKGSGFLIDKSKGLILTNAHVTGMSKSKIRVAFKDKGFVSAKQVYVDPEIDMAIVKVNANDIPKIAKEGKLQCNGKVPNGTSVAAFGHPKGLSFSASRGIISKYRFWIGKDVIQTDAAINSGNSGGPLIDLNTGLIVGINKSSYKDYQGLSFAVPSGYVCTIVNLYIEGKDPSPIDLPIRFAEDREAENYVKVSSFNHKGKNIEIGSLIVAVDGKDINTPTELSFYLRGKSGKAILTFKKNGNRNKYEVNLKPVQKVLERKYLYLSGAVIAKDMRARFEDIEKSFYIHSVKKGTEAEMAGLWQYCWIKSIDGIEPQNLKEIKKITKNKESVDIMTRCYSSRKDVITEDYYVKLKTNNDDIYLN